MLNLLDSSEQYYQRACSLASGSHYNSTNCVFASLSGLGEVYRQKKLFRKSIEMYNAALECANRLRKRDVVGEYDCYEGMSRAYCALTLFDSALVYCDLARDVLSADSTTYQSWLVLNLILKGDIYNEKQDFSQSIDAYQRALSIRKDEYGIADKYVAELYHKLAVVSKGDQDFVTALNYLVAAKKAYSSLASKADTSRASYVLARKKLRNEIKECRKIIH